MRKALGGPRCLSGGLAHFALRRDDNRRTRLAGCLRGVDWISDHRAVGGDGFDSSLDKGDRDVIGWSHEGMGGRVENWVVVVEEVQVVLAMVGDGRGTGYGDVAGRSHKGMSESTIVAICRLNVSVTMLACSSRMTKEFVGETN